MWKGMLRYHLGLIIPGPKGSCRIRVGQDVRGWEERKEPRLRRQSPARSLERLRFLSCGSLRRFITPVIFPVSLVNRAVVWLTARMPSITEPMDRVKNSARAAREAAQAKQ